MNQKGIYKALAKELDKPGKEPDVHPLYATALAKANDLAAGSVSLREVFVAYVEFRYGDSWEAPAHWDRFSRLGDGLAVAELPAFVRGCAVLRDLRREGTA